MLTNNPKGCKVLAFKTSIDNYRSNCTGQATRTTASSNPVRHARLWLSERLCPPMARLKTITRREHAECSELELRCATGLVSPGACKALGLTPLTRRTE